MMVQSKHSKDNCVAILSVGFRVRGKCAIKVDILQSLVKAEIAKGHSDKEFWKAITIYSAPIPAPNPPAHQQQSGVQQLMNPALQVLPIPPSQFQIPNTALQQNFMSPQQ